MLITVSRDSGDALSVNVIPKGGDAQENARIAREILGGTKGPPRDAVVLNAAAALVVAGRARDLREGAGLAAASIDSGHGVALLERAKQASHA